GIFYEVVGIEEFATRLGLSAEFVAQFKAGATAFLDGFIENGDTIVDIAWNSDFSSPGVFNSLAVLRGTGVVYDSLAFFVATDTSVVTQPLALGAATTKEVDTGTQINLYLNRFGTTVAKLTYTARSELTVFPEEIPIGDTASVTLKESFTMACQNQV